MDTRQLNVGMIGYQFMGRAHSHALKSLYMMAGDLQVVPRLKTICGRDEAAVRQMAMKFGWETYETSWEKVVSDPEIDVIVIVAPGHMHAEIAVAAAKNGKHIVCEKPLAMTSEEARTMLETAERYDVKHMVNFNYRKVPAVMLAKQLIDEGKLGRIYSFKGMYQLDWTLDENMPFTWRFDKVYAGAGAMADNGSHLIDLARYLVGEFDEVCSIMSTFIEERPAAEGSHEKKAVTTDDAAVFLARFANGAQGLFGASRLSAGHKNLLSFEINGSKGSLKFELERLNELGVYLADDPDRYQGFRSVMVTQGSHPYIRQWWPPGHVIGWEHTFIHQYYEFFKAIGEDGQTEISFLDGLKCQEVLDAIERADTEKRWVRVGS
jgi:predicted dehydrogenase